MIDAGRDVHHLARVDVADHRVGVLVLDHLLPFPDPVTRISESYLMFSHSIAYDNSSQSELPQPRLVKDAGQASR